MIGVLLTTLAGLTVSTAGATESSTAPISNFGQTVADIAGPRKKYRHLTRTEIPAGEKALNFGTVYAGQWASYFLTQAETLERHGSFRNWRENMFRPHFDRDSFDYNMIGHTASGTIYYLFYRSHGYSTKQSLLWSTASSLAFEFTIETATEKPSFQDMYQTPVFGALAGISLEAASNFLHSYDVWPARVLGYVLNPFGLLPWAEYGFQATPVLGVGQYGGSIAYRF